MINQFDNIRQGINNVSTALAGLNPPCIALSSKKKKANERAYNWRKNNPEKRKAIERRYRKKNKKKLRERSRLYYKLNRNKRIESKNRWKETHPKDFYDSKRIRNKRMVSTPKGNLNHRISCQIWLALRKNKKGKNWEDLVDYTLDDLKKHIENLFKGGMNWEEFLKGNIHIDHIIPKSVFNFSKPEDIDFKRCWALSNLQPMWAQENLKKHTKLNKPFQPSLAL